MSRWGPYAPRTARGPSLAPIDRGGTTRGEKERESDGRRAAAGKRSAVDRVDTTSDDGEGAPAGRADSGAGVTRPLTRRESLRAVGALGAAGLAPVRAGADRRDRHTASDASGADRDGERAREDFLWLGNAQWRIERLRENVLALAAQQDLAVLYGQPPTNAPGVGETLRPALEAASEFGVEAWVNLGVLRDLSAEEFVTDADQRERHLAGLREAAGVIDDLFDGSRVVLWQEAPVLGQWSESGKWNSEAVANMRTHGPRIFESQRDAVREAAPDLDVGIFPHFPYVVDSKHPEVFAELVADLRERGAVPEFGFTDFYPGWYEKDVGLDPATDAIDSLLTNAREHLDRETYYLGQPHTIAPGHTPSAQSIRAYVRTARDAGAAGIGWYPANTYQVTESGFDPMLRNPPDAEFDGGPVTTMTVSRDRYYYACLAALATREDVDPADRFDLWLHGDGFPFYAHRVEARTTDGEWTPLGDAGGYLDGDHPYAGNRTTAFRALDRERFVDDGAVELRVTLRSDREGRHVADCAGSGIVTGRELDPTTLDAVVAMPWDPGNFVGEAEATRLLTGDAPLSASELGRATPESELSPGDPTRVTVPVADESPSLTPLVHPDRAGAVERLAAAEDEENVDPADRFDLWLVGAELDDPEGAPSLVDDDDERVEPAEASLVAVGTLDAALFYGLERDRFLGDDALALVEDDGTEARVDAAYAMPYAGSAAFRSPARARRLLADQPDEAATYALARSGSADEGL